jgi:hypothetical protein
VERYLGAAVFAEKMWFRLQLYFLAGAAGRSA